MDALAEAFGAAWQPFLASLQGNEASLEDLRDYGAADLGQAVVDAIPGCNVHRKNRLVKALQAYFGSKPSTPATTTTTAPADDPQRMQQLMALFQQRMMAMSQEMQVLGMKGDMAGVEALQAKVMALSQDVQCNTLLGGGVAGLEKVLEVGPGPLTFVPVDFSKPVISHQERLAEYGEKFSARVQELSSAIQEAATMGQSTATAERQVRRLSHNFKEAMARSGDAQLQALEAMFQRQEVADVVVPDVPWSAFEGAWKGRLGPTTNYDLVLFEKKIACELLCGPLEVEPGKVKLRVCEDPTPTWGNCNWVDVTLEALDDGELRATQTHHLCDGKGALTVKNLVHYLSQEEDKMKEVAKAFKEKEREYQNSKQRNWKHDIVKAVKLCHTEPALLLLDSVTRAGLVKDINDRVEEGTGNTLLHCAAEADRVELCQVLIDRKADINKYGAEGKRPLDLALQRRAGATTALFVRHSGAASLKLLFECVAGRLVPAVEAVVALLTPKELNTYYEKEDTALIKLLASGGDTTPEFRAILKVLLDAKADPNLPSKCDAHPLNLALKNHPTVVETLLEAGCNMYAALQLRHKSDFMSHAPVTRRMLATRVQEGLQAVLNDDAKAVEQHLKDERRTAMLFLPDEFGFSLLDHACLHGCTRVAGRLAQEVDHSARCDVADFAAWGSANVPWAAQEEKYQLLRAAAATLKAEDRALLCWKGQDAAPVTRQQRRREEAAAASALQSRMQEGIEEATSRVRSFYDAGYVPPPLLTFFAGLDEAAIPRSYAEKSIILWDTKRATLAAVLEDKGVQPLFIAVIFMYTLESDLYRVCNRVMRDADEVGIATWRPFICHLDQALLGLPPQTATLYRGIAIPFDLAKYDVGKTVHWASFTSASAVMDVAVSFLQGDFGLLFILKQESGRAISPYSFYPDEAELLHRPNSVWRVTGIFEADVHYNLQAKALDAEQAKGLPKVVITMQEVRS